MISCSPYDIGSITLVYKQLTKRDVVKSIISDEPSLLPARLGESLGDFEAGEIVLEEEEDLKKSEEDKEGPLTTTSIFCICSIISAMITRGLGVSLEFAYVDLSPSKNF